jgi:S-(hydroxymethyl)glutathione dehydrogenase/alcohol dehydrogenase
MVTIDASVLRAPKELAVEQLNLDDPGPTEVLVDVRSTGVCRSDYERYDGRGDVPYPIVLGHEGAGVVEAVGSSVTTVSPGDHVVLSVTPSCGMCKECERGRPYLCSSGIETAFSGTMMDGTCRLHDGESPIHHFFAQSSFATKAVVPERSAVAVRSDVPFDVMSLMGCGATTGIGAVLNTADVGPGNSVAIFGCGGVGSSAILAADAIGANPIIAVDIDEEKLSRAADLGASHVVNATKTEPPEEIRKHADGGVEYAFEFAGNVSVMEQAVESTQPGGEAVISGSVPAGEDVALEARLLMQGRTIRGNVAGSLRPRVDIPRFIKLYANGRLNIDELLSESFRLHELEDAFRALENGDVIRSVVNPN